MQAVVGTHKGKSMESLVLKEPSYVQWLLGQASATGGLLAMRNEAKNLVQAFDQKPYKVRCWGTNCRRTATRLSVHGNSDPHWWCDTCDPYQDGAADGKLQIFRNYSQALFHVEFFCAGRKSDYRDLVKSMAQAKGLGTRVGETQAKAFFS